MMRILLSTVCFAFAVLALPGAPGPAEAADLDDGYGAPPRSPPAYRRHLSPPVDQERPDDRPYAYREPYRYYATPDQVDGGEFTYRRPGRPTYDGPY